MQSVSRTNVFSQREQFRLFHGSHIVVEKPLYGYGKTNNDYGRGFYCTEHFIRACEWAANAARRHNLDHFGYANEYLLDTDGLKILDLSSKKFTALHWLEVLISHRTLSDLDASIGDIAVEYLHQHFHVDLAGYDIIKGYRADDSYFTFATAFLNGTLTFSTLKQALKAGDLGEQIVLVSEEAFNRIQFVADNPVTDSGYYFRYKANDESARKSVKTAVKANRAAMLAQQLANEETMFTIMQKGMTAKNVSLL